MSRPRTQHNDLVRCSTGIQRASDVFPSTVWPTFHVLYIKGQRLKNDIFLVYCIQVLECCWADLKKQVAEASDLDHIIAAHETFLDQVLNRCLLDAESRVSY